MLLKELREKVYEANMQLPRLGLVIFTWGNASELDPETGLFVIKPSGVAYDELTPEKMVVCDLDGRRVEGNLNPSSDTDTHAWIYRGPTGESRASFTRIPLWRRRGRRPVGTSPLTELPMPITSMARFLA